MKTVALLGDLHCGHLTGLTPPGWEISDKRFKHSHIRSLQIEMWKKAEAMRRSVGKIDLVVVNGDSIDGKGNRSGGTELITADLNDQVDMAEEVLNLFDAKQYLFTYGTKYHTATDSGEDMELVLANRFGSTIQDLLFLDVEGVMFDIKHDVSTSSIPHGRFTSLGKERLWNVLHNERGTSPKADVIVRSHSHYHVFCGDRFWTAMTLPAFQSSWTKFGRRECSGTTDWGFVVFTVDNKKWAWDAKLADICAAQSNVIKL